MPRDAEPIEDLSAGNSGIFAPKNSPANSAISDPGCLDPETLLSVDTALAGGGLTSSADGALCGCRKARALRTLFIITSMPVGGAETLLCELAKRFDPAKIVPEICCLKEPGPLGEHLGAEIPVHSRLLAHKYDIWVLGRLRRLMRRRRIDCVVTVGCGDKLFWGRLAAFLARVKVICSALHSAGMPERIEGVNRLLSPLTDAFIALSPWHARYLALHEGCPPERIHVIPNGVDTVRFAPRPRCAKLRRALELPPEARTAGIVAALRPEKNHRLFLEAAARIRAEEPGTYFLIVGDGPMRSSLESYCGELRLNGCVRFLGTRSDIPDLWSQMEVGLLTSTHEAYPVTLLEAMACGKPVVATQVGAVEEIVQDSRTGFLVPSGDAAAIADWTVQLLRQPALARSLGSAARAWVVEHASVERMVRGYEELLWELYERKSVRRGES